MIFVFGTETVFRLSHEVCCARTATNPRTKLLTMAPPDGNSLNYADEQYHSQIRPRTAFTDFHRCCCCPSGRASPTPACAIRIMLERFSNLSQHEYTTNWREPWIFGVPDEKERQFFDDCGFDVRDFLSFFGREAVRRYLTRSDSRSLGSIRGGRPSRQAITTMIRVIWIFLTKRSRWYAFAVLSVRDR